MGFFRVALLGLLALLALANANTVQHLGGIYHQPSGDLWMDPSGVDSNDLSSVWVIVVPDDHDIIFTVTELGPEATINCFNDFQAAVSSFGVHIAQMLYPYDLNLPQHFFSNILVVTYTDHAMIANPVGFKWTSIPSGSGNGSASLSANYLDQRNGKVIFTKFHTSKTTVAAFNILSNGLGHHIRVESNVTQYCDWTQPSQICPQISCFEMRDQYMRKLIGMGEQPWAQYNTTVFNNLLTLVTIPDGYFTQADDSSSLLVEWIQEEDGSSTQPPGTTLPPTTTTTTTTTQPPSTTTAAPPTTTTAEPPTTTTTEPPSTAPPDVVVIQNQCGGYWSLLDYQTALINYFVAEGEMYPQDVSCPFSIYSPWESMELEIHEIYSEKHYDGLTVVHMSEKGEFQSLRIVPTDTGYPVISVPRSICHIIFDSDDSVESRGFSMTVRGVGNLVQNLNKVSMFLVEEASGSLKYPSNYPDGIYENNEKVSIAIPKKNGWVDLTVDYQLEERWDWLDLYEFPHYKLNEPPKNLARLTGKEIATISSDKTMLGIFWSDSSTPDAGFHCSWSTTFKKDEATAE